MSWVASLFNPAKATPTGFAPSNDRQPPVFSNVQENENGSSSKYRERWAKEYAQSVEEEEEEYEARNPYWQVSQRRVFPTEDHELKVSAVYDSWRLWWNIWRPPDALHRYCQDPSARRPTYPAQVWIIIFCVRPNLSSGRFSKRSLQRCCSGLLRILPRHHHLLWILRIQQEAYVGCWHKSVTILSRRRYESWIFNHAKRKLTSAGFIADFAASFVYVPSEVLKTRLQLQGRYNNPFFTSGYNYRGTIDAARTIVHREGTSALFHGYKATIFRDLPFSALQFAFYEQERNWAKKWKGSADLGIGLELATAASAGGVAGVMTCPLDVVKTRIQTQINPPETVAPPNGGTKMHSQPLMLSRMENVSSHSAANNPPMQVSSRRLISTSSPNTSTPKPDAVKLDTSSVMTGLRLVYKTEGIIGLFRGVGPRAVWTSVQSGTMLVCYQELLKRMGASPWLNGEGSNVV